MKNIFTISMSGAIAKIIPKRESEIINFETHHNKPDIDGSYPRHIVNRRTLLLFAQCFLADYQTAKTRRCKSFYGKLYRTTMNAYFNW